MQQGVSLGQLATEEKSNEITAIPDLIDQIEVKDAVVTIDAAGCQRSIAAKIIRPWGVAVHHATIGEKQVEEVRYCISSLPPSVKQFAGCARGHWAIENTLHGCLDVTFREDESRVRDRTPADNLAWLKRFTIGLLKKVPDKESIAMRRRMAGWNCNYYAKVLGLSRT